MKLHYILWFLNWWTSAELIDIVFCCFKQINTYKTIDLYIVFMLDLIRFKLIK